MRPHCSANSDTANSITSFICSTMLQYWLKGVSLLMVFVCGNSAMTILRNSGIIIKFILSSKIAQPLCAHLAGFPIGFSPDGYSKQQLESEVIIVVQFWSSSTALVAGASFRTERVLFYEQWPVVHTAHTRVRQQWITYLGNYALYLILPRTLPSYISLPYCLPRLHFAKATRLNTSADHPCTP
jgi:hypothetical protein